MKQPSMRWVLLTVGCFLLPAMLVTQTRAESTYRGTQGRFTARIPAGWTASDLGGPGAKISQGAASVSVLVLEGTNAPDNIVVGKSQEAAENWTKFQEIMRGKMTIAGQPAAFGLYSGVNHKGAPAFLKIVVLTATGRAYLLMSSAPQREYASVKDAMDQIEQSFALGGGGLVPATGRQDGDKGAGADQVKKRLAALDAAYQAGVLTRGEYERKKTALLGRGRSGAGTGADQVKNQLEALDAAYKGGVVTRELYEAKKAAILGGGRSGAGTGADQVKNQLEVLDAAYKGGVVTRELYEAKKAAILGAGGAGGGAPGGESPNRRLIPAVESTGGAQGSPRPAVDPSGPLRQGGQPSPNRVTAGIIVREPTQQEAKAAGINTEAGAFVERVVPGGPAAQAGMQRGDIIVTINRQAVAHIHDVDQLFARRNPGDEVEVVTLRAGQPKVYKLHLVAAPPPSAP